LCWWQPTFRQRDSILRVGALGIRTHKLTYTGVHRAAADHHFYLVAQSSHMQVTPHVAQNHNRSGGSAIDELTTRQEGYRISQRKQKQIEECFGWLKTIALLRKVRHRGLRKVDWVFAFACPAYNLVRFRNLSIQSL
jgi:hypothetical protein